MMNKNVLTGSIVVSEDDIEVVPFTKAQIKEMHEWQESPCDRPLLLDEDVWNVLDGLSDEPNLNLSKLSDLVIRERLTERFPGYSILTVRNDSMFGGSIGCCSFYTCSLEKYKSIKESNNAG
jgi:hypothetical protein